MTTPSEQFSAVWKANLEIARQFTTFGLQCTEQAMRLPLQAAQQLIKSGEQSGLLRPDGSIAKLLADLPALYQDGMQKAMEVTHTYFETAVKTQSEFGRLFQEQAELANRTFTDTLQGFAKMATAGNEMAANALKDMAEPGEHRSRKVG